MLFESFNTVAIELSIVNSFSSDSLIGEEIQKFVPSDLVVVLAIALIDQPSQTMVVKFNALLKFSSQVLFQNSMVFHWSVLWEMLRYRLELGE